MASTRLPGKVMKNLYGKTILTHVIDRVKQSKLIDEIIIATTDHERDNIIVKEVEKNCAKYFRGSEDDVLSRYYYAAKENDGDIIVRITSDCPLIDPFVIDEMLEIFRNNNYDLVTNAGTDLSKRTYPRGLDTEIFTFSILEKAYLDAKKKYQREHVTPYIYENINNIYYYKNNKDYSKYRWTLDTEEDFILIEKIYNYFYKYKNNFYLNDIIEYLNRNSNIIRINQHIKQKILREDINGEK